MQFVDSSSFGVRSAIYEVARPDVPLEFVLFPMIHIGEAGYYEDVGERAGKCDVLLVEGVPSLPVRIASRAYARFASRLGLVTQKRLNVRSIGPRVLNVDMCPAEFDAAHAQLPLAARLLLPVVLPAYSLWFRFAGTRDQLAASLTTNDLRSRADLLSSASYREALDDLILHKRDRIFLNRLQRFFTEHSSEPLRAGIIYGAGHMPVITRYLLGPLRYRVRSATWIQVFALT